MISKLLVWLEGRKTFGTVALGLGLIAAVSIHWIEIDPKLYSDLKSALILGAIAALRASK